MNADQIVWARAVAEESYDGQLIRDLCDALAEAWDEGRESLAADFLRPTVNGFRPAATNPYRDAA